MNFEDRSNTNVQSLLALLRTAQGDDPGTPSAAPSATPGASASARVGTNGSSSRTESSGGASRHASASATPSETTSEEREREGRRRWAYGAVGGDNSWAKRSLPHSPTLAPSDVSRLLAQLGPPPGISLSRPPDAGIRSGPARPARPAGSGGSTGSGSTGSGSAFDGARHGLLDPFGPVGVTPRGGTRWDAGRGTGTGSGVGAGAGMGVATGTAVGTGVGGGERAGNGGAALGAAPGTDMPRTDTPPADKGKRRADDMDNPADWAFTRCLPVVAELLRDEAFVRELRKMKSEQHALERRLWARMEKLKAEHAKRAAGEQQVAKITRKAVPTRRVVQWDDALMGAIDDFFAKQVLPTMDGVAARQRARLVELGVPGLGSGTLRLETDRWAGSGAGGSRRTPIKVDDDNSQDEALRREKERVGRIMAVLESALAEG